MRLGHHISARCLVVGHLTQDEQQLATTPISGLLEANFSAFFCVPTFFAVEKPFGRKKRRLGTPRAFFQHC